MERRTGPYALREYAVLLDGERGVVTGPNGDFVWMCFPYWHSPPVFSSLVGGGGMYEVAPVDPWRVWGGYYEDGSLVWRRRWVMREGVVECREAMLLPGEGERALILRRIKALDGPARIRARLEARADFGRRHMTGLRLEDGVWAARSGDIHVRWAGAPDARCDDGALCVEIDLEEGQTYDLLLELSSRPSDAPLNPDVAWSSTEAAWRAAVPPCDGTLAPHDTRFAYALLTGLTSTNGGMVAAVTSSLPERLRGDRNYDYRYAWIRDQCYAGLAVAAHGERCTLLDDAVRFLTERIMDDGERLKPAYTVAGGDIPGEKRHERLGYPGSALVTGNRVIGQFQLDVFGELLNLFAAAARADRLSAEAAAAARVAVGVISERWDRPDAGIWETGNRYWTHSRLACVAGLRAASAAIASRAETGRWLSLAETILADTTRRCLHSSGHWQRAADDGRVDASLLMPPIRGALTAADPRTKATFDAVREQLVDEGFVYRYRPDGRPLGEAEGAFTLCGFLLALAEHQQGLGAQARERFERVRSACGTTGLFTEEYDVRQRQLRANLPQAFVHALFLEVSHTLAN